MTKPNPFRRVLLIITCYIVCDTVCLCNAHAYVYGCAISFECPCVVSALCFYSLSAHLITHFRRYALWLIIMQHRNTTNGLKFSFLCHSIYRFAFNYISHFSANYFMVTHIPSNLSVVLTCGTAIAICVCVCANGTFQCVFVWEI